MHVPIFYEEETRRLHRQKVVNSLDLCARSISKLGIVLCCHNTSNELNKTNSKFPG